MDDRASSDARVVVIDDDPMVARTLSDVLATHGHRVETFTSPGAAIRALETMKDVDAIVSDVSMPEMTGLEMLAVLRRTHPDVPVVLLTGAPKVEDAMRAMELGVVRYLAKPVDAARVREVVGEAVQWGRLTRARGAQPFADGRRLCP